MNRDISRHGRTVLIRVNRGDTRGFETLEPLEHLVIGRSIEAAVGRKRMEFADRPDLSRRALELYNSGHDLSLQVFQDQRFATIHIRQTQTGQEQVETSRRPVHFNAPVSLGLEIRFRGASASVRVHVSSIGRPKQSEATGPYDDHQVHEQAIPDWKLALNALVCAKEDEPRLTNSSAKLFYLPAKGLKSKDSHSFERARDMLSQRYGVGAGDLHSLITAGKMLGDVSEEIKRNLREGRQ